jgi:hypothetical protein
MELRFYEDLLKTVIKKDLAIQSILQKYKVGERDVGQEDIYDFEKYLTAMNEIRNAGQEEKKKLLKKYCSSFTKIDELLEAFNEKQND